MLSIKSLGSTDYLNIPYSLISLQAPDKGTMPLTIPHCIYKSATKERTFPIFELSCAKRLVNIFI